MAKQIRDLYQRSGWDRKHKHGETPEYRAKLDKQTAYLNQFNHDRDKQQAAANKATRSKRSGKTTYLEHKGGGQYSKESDYPPTVYAGGRYGGTDYYATLHAREDWEKARARRRNA